MGGLLVPLFVGEVDAKLLLMSSRPDTPPLSIPPRFLSATWNAETAEDRTCPYHIFDRLA